uniref:Alcohol dehydrogenase-like C-terminal domain-containing protein n=1 Tax=Thermodesulfobium narugense TaxID=184064 RepID=A0A7C5KC92_9BACT
MSCSYGPVQYDSLYEEKAINYPLPYLRWTEKKNFEAVLDMMSSDRINVKSLITHRFLFDNVLEAYDILLKGNSLGIVLQYKPSDLAKRNEIIILNESCLSMFLHLL